MFSTRCITLSTLIFFSIALNAAERSIGINFTGGSNATGGNPSSLENGDSVGVVPKSNWNNGSGNNGTIRSLTDDSGRPTGASAKWESYGTWSLNVASTSANGRLMKGYLD